MFLIDCTRFIIMNKYTLTLLILLTCFGFKTSVYAQAKTCPTAGSIISAGLLFAERDEDSASFIVGQVSNYNTIERWGFVLFVPFSQAANKTQALTVARQALPSLNANFATPIYKDGYSICLYTANGLQAGTITPLSFSLIAKNIRQYR